MSIYAYTCKAQRRIKTFLNRQKKSIDVKSCNKYVIEGQKLGKMDKLGKGKSN